jgi:hypothetical protein
VGLRGLEAAVMSTLCAQRIICHQQSWRAAPGTRRYQHSAPVAGNIVYVPLLPLTVVADAVRCKPG